MNSTDLILLSLSYVHRKDLQLHKVLQINQTFQIFLLVSFEVAAHNDNAPVGDAANTTTVFPETDV
jgi:hypothetical protein